MTTRRLSRNPVPVSAAARLTRPLCPSPTMRSPAGKRRPIIRQRAVWRWGDVFPQRHAAIGTQFIQLSVWAARARAAALEPRRILENGWRGGVGVLRDGARVRGQSADACADEYRVKTSGRSRPLSHTAIISQLEQLPRPICGVTVEPHTMN